MINSAWEAALQEIRKLVARRNRYVDAHDWDADGKPGWQVTFGYDHETYEKRRGRWLLITRRWRRYFGAGLDGVFLPTEPVKGSDAFASPEA